MIETVDHKNPLHFEGPWMFKNRLCSYNIICMSKKYDRFSKLELWKSEIVLHNTKVNQLVTNASSDLVTIIWKLTNTNN